jgi:cysteinyl-tRNA synthetase
MKFQFYNSLTNTTQNLKPVEPDRVRMYSCGPTVYDFAHIGNFRSFLFGDLLRRSLELGGYEVDHVMNITDVGHMVEGEEDKMKKAGDRVKERKKDGRVEDGAIEDPNDPWQIADYFTNAFIEDGRKLAYKVAFEYPEKVPRATDHIDGMIKMIERLLEKGHAYVAGDAVYFSTESFPEYGKLSGNSMSEIQSGAGGRVNASDQSTKKHPADFLLWKADETHLMKWDSPWGVGYPGWHIECSVMASKVLGADVIDIHTGGEDLIFPHHECEIAQSCGCSGESSFANLWIHARFLFIEGEKMSKSAGNFYTARDVFEGKVKGPDGKPMGQPVHPAVLRFELIKSHYRSNLNFTAKGLVDSAASIQRLMKFRADLESKTGGKATEVDLAHPVLGEFAKALADDLNIAAALGVMHPWVRGDHPDPHESLGVWKAMNSVLQLAPMNEGVEGAEVAATDSGGDDGEAEQWRVAMVAARKDKDYAASDDYRAKLLDAGYEVEISKDDVTIRKKLV